MLRKVILIGLFGFSSLFRQSDQGLIKEYLKCVKNEKVPLEKIIEEYCPALGIDNAESKHLVVALGALREKLAKAKMGKMEILKAREARDEPKISGLNSLEGAYVVYYEEEFISPFLIVDGKIVSTMLYSKGGDKKYFLRFR